jgi:predicted nucleic acid-binding protein
MNAVDTNIFLYSIDRGEPAKQLKAQQLLLQLRTASQPTFLLWQVLGELGRQLRRWRDQGKLTPTEFRQHIQVLRYLFPLALPTSAVFDLALNLADYFSLSHWDGMLLGACQAAGIATLYTEDMGAPKIIDGIQLINPLA